VFHHSPNESFTTPGFRRKLIAYGMKPGWPDLEIAHQGKLYCIELKWGRNQPTKTQRERHDDLRNAGVPVRVCRSQEEVLTFLDDCSIPLRLHPQLVAP
jgi:hypothetical protein